MGIVESLFETAGKVVRPAPKSITLHCAVLPKERRPIQTEITYDPNNIVSVEGAKRQVDRLNLSTHPICRSYICNAPCPFDAFDEDIQKLHRTFNL